MLKVEGDIVFYIAVKNIACYNLFSQKTVGRNSNGLRSIFYVIEFY